MTLRRLQGYVAELSRARGGAPSATSAVLFLAEETGEVARAVAGAMGVKQARLGYDFGDVGYELADVIVCAALIAEPLGIDLSRAVAEKLRDLSLRSMAGIKFAKGD